MDKLPQYLEGKVHPQCLVRDVIGFLCWRYVHDQHEPKLKSSNVDHYSLYLADSDGSIEWELRPIERLEPISKFGFSDYALVIDHNDETDTAVLDVKITLPDGTYTVLQLPSRDISAKGLIEKAMARHKFRQRSGVNYTYFLEPKSTPGKALEPSQTLHVVDDIEFFIVRENSRRCAEFEPSKDNQSKFLEFYAMDAATYQEYRDVWLITKIRSKMAVVLAISQEKFDIFPHQTPSGRLWAAAHSIPKEGSFNMETIVACEITEKTEDEEIWTFRIVLEHKVNAYKKVYFQALKETVSEIHNKVSHLLQWHSSQARSNYIVYKELKSRRRKTNIF